MKERREQDLHQVEHIHQEKGRNHTGRINKKHQEKKGAKTKPNHTDFALFVSYNGIHLKI